MANNKQLIYDSIEMDPIEELFEKIYSARGGEMLLIHIPPYSKGHKKVAKCFSVLDAKNSMLIESLPTVVKDILKDIQNRTRNGNE